MRVLVFEAARFMADCFREVIDGQDHTVTCFNGIATFSPRLIGVDYKFREVDVPQRFDAALVDSFVGHPTLLGTTIVSQLKARGIPCLAMSCSEESNRQMLAAGAQFAMPKIVALAALYTGTLQIEDICDPSNRVQVAIASLAAGLSTNTKVRSALRELIERHNPHSKAA